MWVNLMQLWGLDPIATWILVGCAGAALLRLVEAFAARQATSGPDKRKTEQLESRLAALEARSQETEERLETMRTLVLSGDYEARRRLAEKLSTEEVEARTSRQLLE